VDAEQAAQRQSLSDAFRAVYSRLAERARKTFPEATLVATGHLTCLSQAGLKPSAEDAIPVEINRVGTLGAMGPEIFDERFAYVALGHIHRGFSVDRAGRVRYSGTPVQVGAAEKAEDRRVLLVELTSETGAIDVRPLPVPARRRLVTLAGDYDEVAERLRTLSWAETELPPYVVLEARRTTFELGAQDRLMRLAPAGPGGVAVVVETRIALEAPGGVSARGVADLPLGTSITPEAAFRFAWDTRNRGVELTEPVLQRFRSLLEAGAGQD
jgi:exonuclease SbcD